MQRDIQSTYNIFSEKFHNDHQKGKNFSRLNPKNLKRYTDESAVNACARAICGVPRASNYKKVHRVSTYYAGDNVYHWSFRMIR